MYKVFPALILRAAGMRTQCLELGGLNDYYASASAPSSSTLVAAAPSATNIYTLAFGEREGLAPGERLEVYGNTVRLVRTLAYGCPRGVTAESAFTGRLTADELSTITAQLDVLKRQSRETRRTDAAATVAAAESSAGGEAAKAVESEWTLRVPEVKGSRVLRQEPPSDPQACTGRGLAAQLQELSQSEEEVVVAEWVGKVRDAALVSTSSFSPKLPARRGSDGSAGPGAEASDALLIENGVCYRAPECCGLRALRTARLAFISSIERTANGLARRQRRQTGDEARRLAVLDVNALDFTFAQAALQSTLELGLHSGAGCQISHVPLTNAAAAQVEAQTASYIQVVAAGAGRALPRPFDFVPAYSIDVGAYTAHLPLPVGPSSNDGSSSSSGADTDDDGAAGAEKRRRARSRSSSNRRSVGAGADRQQTALQLSQALATLRRGACMLVCFVPTCSSTAALYHEMETQRRAEVLIEHKVVTEAKACIAEAIARTGRWGFITDEVLPAVDSPQGSFYSLVVMLE